MSQEQNNYEEILGGALKFLVDPLSTIDDDDLFFETAWGLKNFLGTGQRTVS